jgi:hypothetical protein
MSSDSNAWWIGPLVLTLLRLLYAEARLTHAAAKDGALVFRAGMGMRVLLGVGILGFSVGTLASIGHEETWLLVASTGIVIALCVAWPATVVIAEDGVRRHVWWRRTAALPWKEVSGIERNAGGDIQVFGKSGQCITFTRFHIDPLRFQEEVKRRARLQNVIDASAPPSLHA